MSVLDECGYYKEADDVFSLVRTAQRKKTNVPLLQFPFDPNRRILTPGLDGETILPGNNRRTTPTGLNGETILPGRNRRIVPPGLGGETILPGSNRRIAPTSLDGETILPGSNRRIAPTSLDGETILPGSNRRTTPTSLDGETILPGNNRRTTPTGLDLSTILDAYDNTANSILSQAYKLRDEGKTIPKNFYDFNPFEHNPDLHRLPGTPDASVFAKIELVMNAFRALDPKSIDAQGNPAPHLNQELFNRIAKKYYLPDLLTVSLMRPRIKEDPNITQNRSAFFAKAAQIEQLVAKNPDAWSKFINNPFVSRMINKDVLGMFKNLGTNSKSLSQSIKGLNMNSPLWALLEPALEFGLYQFGLYLENPSGYNLETPEQKTIKYLNTRINEILADNKIQDKRGYFMKNYGNDLKQLGTMEQNELLGKFPVMPFNQFMNVGKNLDSHNKDQQIIPHITK